MGYYDVIGNYMGRDPYPFGPIPGKGQKTNQIVSTLREEDDGDDGKVLGGPSRSEIRTEDME